MNPARNRPRGIAIVGMAGRFPKARNIDEFWKNLCDGVDGISFFDDAELAAAGVVVPKDSSNYVKARGVVDDAEMFDAAFFGVNPKEAEVLDPQHRLFLECAWEALESAGYDSEKFPGAIGVFAGMSMNTYLAHIVRSRPELVDLVGEYQTMLANDKDFLPTRVSYKLNLRGPSLNIQTACSTSLVAICEACQHLLNSQCDMALAGAVSLRFPRKGGYVYQEGGIASPDGHCRAFDAKSAGTVMGEGVGIVVLKRVEDAIADGDVIYAVVKGFATNNDGSQKVGYTAPSVEGQGEVIALAQAMAGIEPESVGYLEAHGTGTKLGDPIEVEALTKAFRLGTPKRSFCAIGSVKSNIGHLDTAAGVAGLIKAALALHHKKIPASLHFESPNPEIDFANSPFFVNTTLRDWNGGKAPRRAGISSFGIGGTNAHVLLEEAPVAQATSQSRPEQLLLLSAKTPSALDSATTNLGIHLQEHSQGNLADAAYTLQVGRRGFAHRRMLVCRDCADAAEQLTASASKRVLTATATEENPSVVFMFPGQGSQHVNMGRGLYETEEVFREQVDLCCKILEPILGFDLRTVLYPEADKVEEVTSKLVQTAVTQPSLFVVEYSLAKLWMSWGIKPGAMIGHSIGEYVAACLSGVFSLEDALKLVADRARLMQQQPTGAMLAVRLAETDIQPLLNDRISLATVNATTGCVLSGPKADIDAARDELVKRNVACAVLQTSHAFHSAMMQPVVEPFAALLAAIEMNAPQIPFISNVTGGWIMDGEATNPGYWTAHLRGTVRFADGIGELLKETGRIFLEVGPGQVLAGLTNQHPSRTSETITLSALPRAGGETSDTHGILSALGKLWIAGVEVDWTGFWEGERRHRMRLPTYPFERKRYYVEPRLTQEKSASGIAHVINGHVDLPQPAIAVLSSPTKSNGHTEKEDANRELVLKQLTELLSELSGCNLVGKTHLSFTELGFDSLFLTQASLAIEKKLNVRVAFRQLLESFFTLDSLATHVAGKVPSRQEMKTERSQGEGELQAASEDRNPASARNLTEIPLTDAQRELWLASQMSEAASCAYNECRLLHLRGVLQTDCLRRALEKVVQRHEALRTTFAPSGESQIVQPAIVLEVSESDLSTLSEKERATQLDALQAEEAVRPFNLISGPLVRVQLIRLTERHHVLAVAIHHIVCDGYSFGIVLHDLAQVYAAECRHTADVLEEPLQLSAYAHEQARRSQEKAHSEAEAYWLSEFLGEIPVLDLPTDQPRPAAWRFEGARETRVLPPRLTTHLKQLSADRDCTLFTTLLSVYGVLLRKLSGQKDVIVGIPIADRMMERGETLVGHCVNFLPLRLRVEDHPFAEFLGDVKRKFLDAFEHQKFTFGSLIQKLNVPRSRDRAPLVSVTFNVERLGEKLNLVDLDVELVANAYGFSNFDLSLNVAEVDGTLQVDCRYNKSLFAAKTIRRWLEHFQTALESVVANVHQPVAEVAILTKPELQQIVKDWNGTQTDFPRHKCVHHVFEAQVENTPNAVAVEFDGVRLTYRELNAQANQLAHYLMRLGVAPDVRVAVCLDRSVHMIVGVLAILKAGGTYVSLDPSHPIERLAVLLDDIQPPVMLVQEKVLDRLPDLSKRGMRDGIVCDTVLVSMDGGWETMAWRIDTNPVTEVRADNLAYVSFTSGSTGKPKGVCVTHRGVVRLVKNTDYATFTPDDVFVQLAPLAFDASTFEIWGPLLNGGRLALLPPFTPSLAELGRFIRTRKVTTLFITTGLFHQMVEDHLDDLRGVRQLLTGGDVLSKSHAREALNNLTECRLSNVYGPTENTTFTSCHRIVEADCENHSVPIGRPIANTQIFILDENLQVTPIGVVGELYTGGDGLARGYLNQPERTAEKFIPNPVAGNSGERLYKTGDRARWLPDGTIEFLGRMDSQVKIRGFRVEPGEVETVLQQHPAVRDCVILAVGDTEDRRLVAYVVPEPGSNGHADPQELRRFLESKLPTFMIPATFSSVDAFPLSPSGKVNRKALPAVALETPILDKRAEPQTPMERQIAKIWCDLLGRKSVGIHENFFELGGHSLLVTRAVARIRNEFHVELPMRLFFESPTVTGLAAAVDEEISRPVGQAVDSLVAIQPRGSKNPLFLVHGAGGGMLWGYTTLARCLGLDQPIYAFKSRGLEGLPEFTDIEAMAAHYVADLRAFQPHGPYLLGGYCFGGNVAYEMARQLEAAGEKIEMLALMNSVPAASRYGHAKLSWRWGMAFIRNVRYLFGCHFQRSPVERRDFFAWQMSTLGRRLARFFLAAGRKKINATEVVDLHAYPDSEREIWEAHVQALFRHKTGSYSGCVTLLRSPGHQFWCSFDRTYGWSDYAKGGVDVHVVPGAHEEILEEPHIHILTEKLKEKLKKVRAAQVSIPVRSPVEVPSLLRPVVCAPLKDVAKPLSVDWKEPLADFPTVQRSATDLKEEIIATQVNESARPSTTLSEMSEEMTRMLFDWNATELNYPTVSTLVSLFEAQAERTPEAIALVAGNERLSYRELNKRANQLAHHLGKLGVGPEVLIGICQRRSWRMIVGILGVLKAGGAYVPMDPAYPKDRLLFMLEDARAKVVLTEQDLVPLFTSAAAVHTGVQLVCLDAEWEKIAKEPAENSPVGASPDNLAYVIYTSGSTGQPKGVAIEHRSPVGLMYWAREVFSPEELSGVLAATSICFDLSIYEMFVPLSWGGKIILADNAIGLVGLPAANEVTLINTVPSAMRQLLRMKGIPASARVVNLAGEPLATALVDQIYAETAVQKVYDLYGPTETTTYSTGGLRKAGEPATIGRPLANEQVYLLDADLKPVKVGEAGELLIGGIGVARGYLHRLELTAQRFIPNPFKSGERLYRTGDLARWREDGNLIFLGRIDHQVKIRGFRIELGEIEAGIRRHADVREAAVIARDHPSGEKWLVAYVVPREGVTVPEQALRDLLREKLPDYMIPSAFVFLDVLPLTPNGKLDRKALPEPELEPRGDIVAPRTTTETTLVEIWREVLGIQRIGVEDNFFQLGGHSLLAIQVASRARSSLGVELPLQVLFDAPTIAVLAEGIDSGRWKAADREVVPLERVPRSGPLPVSFVQERLWFIHQIQPDSHAYNVPIAVRLRGKLNFAALNSAFDEVAKRHEAFRTSFTVDDGNLSQVITAPAHIDVQQIDLQNIEVSERSAKADEAIRTETQRPFDLARSPLLRVTLLKLGAEEHILVVVMHHTISDGWSLAVLFEELESFYNQFLGSGAHSRISSLEIQPADIALWQRRNMTGVALDMELAHWKRVLAGAPNSISLPVDETASDAPENQAGRALIQFSKEFGGKMDAWCQKRRGTPFMICLAALTLTLWRWTGQRDLTIGTVTAGRNRREVENLIGCFMNFLPLRCIVKEDKTIEEFFEEARTTVLDAQGHQDCPFQQIVEAIKPERKKDQNPLYNVGLLLQNFPRQVFKSEGLQSELVPIETEAALLDLRFEAEETGAGLALSCEYKTALFAASTIEHLLGSFRQILEKIVDCPDAKVSEVRITEGLETQAKSAHQEKELLAVTATFTADFLADSLRYWMKELNLPVSVEFAPYQQVFQQLLDPTSLLGRNPYGMNLVLIRLEDWKPNIDQAARELVSAVRTAASRSATPHLVCFCPSAKEMAFDYTREEEFQRMERSLGTELASIPGVHVITSAQLLNSYPVSDYYDARADELGHVPYTAAFFAGLGTMVARKLHGIKRPPLKVVVLDCDQTLWAGVCGEDGPEGVSLDPDRRILQEFMRKQLDAGRLLCICSKNNEQDVIATFERHSEMPLQREHFVATRINWRPKSENIKSLAEELNLGLDSFVFVDDNPMECAEVTANTPEVAVLQLPEKPEAIPQFLKHAWIFDVTKATKEDAQRTAFYKANREREVLRKSSSTLADFISALELSVEIEKVSAEQISRVAQLTQRTNQFNSTTQRLTEGEVARLCEQRDSHVLSVTVSDRFGDYGLTGAMFCRVSDNALVVDDLLLSCRVLGKGVEYRMLACLGEIAKQHGLATVEIQFVSSAKNKPALDFLEGFGPAFRKGTNAGVAFCFPTEFAISVTADALKVDPNDAKTTAVEAKRHVAPSKVRTFDRWRWIALRADEANKVLELVESHVVKRNSPAGTTEPRTKTEKQLCKIWQDLLRIEKVGIHDDFFDLGGHSLLAVRLFAEIGKLTGTQLPLVTIFQSPTIAKLAQQISKAEPLQETQSIFVPIQPRGSRPPLFLVHGAGGDVLWGYANLAHHLGADQPVYGIQARPTDDPAQIGTLEEMAAEYVAELLMFHPHGPYCLGGYCFGGNLAYEMARQLRARGCDVPFVVLIESTPAGGTYERMNWLQPRTPFRFARNSYWWMRDFMGLSSEERRSLVRRKMLVLTRKFTRKFRGTKAEEVIDLDDVIDATKFREEELRLWDIHLRLLQNHISGQYNGHVTVFRTAAHPLFCSYEHDMGWGALAEDGVTVRIVPGSHGNIFLEPNVRALAEQMAASIATVAPESTGDERVLQVA